MDAARPGAVGHEASAVSGPRRVGLLGGSFDPVHTGHLHAASCAQRAFDLELVVFMPAAAPPHKLARRLAPGADRLAMLELAIEREPSWRTSDLELSRAGPSYTIDTVRELPRALGLAGPLAVHLILGSDNLRGLFTWQRSDELIELVQPVVVQRAGDPEPDLEPLLRGRAPVWRAKLARARVDAAPSPGRSTDARESLARGGDPGETIPERVREYIRARGLYTNG